MKLKRVSEDFRVEELIESAATGAGEFALYRLTKRDLGTPEAVEAILRRWNLSRKQIAYCGLKDRHAVTTQFLTIRRGPHRGLRQTNLDLEYLGQTAQPLDSAVLIGNRFHVVLRSMSRLEVDAAETALSEVRRDGLPNYFDDQRFGSLGASGEFVARAWISGDYERAAWLALAEENAFDRSSEREQKRLLRNLWGDWAACKTQLDRSHRRSIVTYLCDRPKDFRGAVARIRVDLRSIYVSAFQSFLWNRLLAALILQKVRLDAMTLVPLKLGLFPFFTTLDDETRASLHSTSLPLPSSRTRLDDGPVKQLVDDSLAELGLTLREIRIKYPRDSFFSKGWRAATFSAEQLEWQTADDELDAGKQKLSLRFDLPRGSYATILVKRITDATKPT